MIDDEPSAVDRRLLKRLEAGGVIATLRLPWEITEDDLRDVSVIAVDEYLTTWPGRDGAPFAMQILDGIALAASLRTQLELGPLREQATSTAFVVRTNDLARLAGALPQRAGQHLVAAHHGLDWVQAKRPPRGMVSEHERISQLARAVLDLPSDWIAAEQTLPREVLTWLGLRRQSWLSTAARQIEECRPASHRLAVRTRGTSFLRWFLHGVLPYPSFLVGDIRAATALGITVETFRRLVDEDTELAELMSDAHYTGHLATFFGRRWWRAGLGDAAWTLTDGRPSDRQALLRAFLEKSNRRISGLEIGRQYVVVLDESYEPKPDAAPIERAVRIRPDDWPSYADDAWALIDDVNNSPDLAALVVSSDRNRLEDGDS